MYLGSQRKRTCLKRLQKLKLHAKKLHAYNERIPIDQVIVGREDIYLQNKNVKKLNILITTCFIN